MTVYAAAKPSYGAAEPWQEVTIHLTPPNNVSSTLSVTYHNYWISLKSAKFPQANFSPIKFAGGGGANFI